MSGMERYYSGSSVKALVVCLLLFGDSNRALAQVSGKLPLDESKPKLYLCMAGVESDVKGFQQENNIGTVKLVWGRSISPTNDLNVNFDSLESGIKRLFPNPAAKGIAALDWEGKALDILRKGNSNDPVYISTLDKYIKVLQLAKKLRPNVYWGFYGIPFREYWNRNEKWRASSNKMTPLLQQADVLFPSLYMPYQPTALRAMADKSYTRDNLEQVLRLAATLNKPVLPFVWHRSHDSHLIPVDVFTSQIKQILSENVNDKKVAGIVWWGSDIYSYIVKDKVLRQEVNPGQDFKAHYGTLIRNYGKEVMKVMQQQ